LNDLSKSQSFSCKKVTYTNKMEIWNEKENTYIRRSRQVL
jgi:hypothetical protein